MDWLLDCMRHNHGAEDHSSAHSTLTTLIASRGKWAALVHVNEQGLIKNLGRSTYGINQHLGSRVPLGTTPEESNEEGAGLINHAQENPSSRAPSPFREYEAEPYESDLGYRGAAQRFEQQTSYPAQTVGYQDHRPVHPYYQQQPGHALSTDDYHEARPGVNMSVYSGRDTSSVYPDDDGVAASRQQQPGAGQPRDAAQATIGAALWGQNPHQHPNGPMI